jgi:hypothetical protein
MLLPRNRHTFDSVTCVPIVADVGDVANGAIGGGNGTIDGGGLDGMLVGCEV